MSKLVPSISGIACFLWVAVWSWWLTSKNGGSEAASPSLFTFGLEHKDFEFSIQEPFYFLESDAVVYLSDEAITMLDSLSVFLANQPEEVLTLTGKYAARETNKTEHANLGLARADAIRQYLISKDNSLEERLKTMGLRADNSLLYSGKWMGGVDFSFSKTVEGGESNPQPESGSLPSATAPTGWTIEFSNGSYELDKSYHPQLDELKRMLREQPDKVVMLKGYSKATEEKVKSGDLAELRALAVRRYLVDAGVRRKQIKVEGRTESSEHHVKVVIE